MPIVPNDVFSGIGAAHTSKRSLKLPLGKHVCRINNAKIHTGKSGVFYILEFDLLKTDVEGLAPGPDYAFLIDPNKATVFGPWLKGLIRAVLKLDFSAASEAMLLAEADGIARASIHEGVLNGKIFGVVQSQQKAIKTGNDYIRQDWFAADDPKA